ncbi:hypothetical protein predicted by Glimmer/Critica [Bdellovibrio bacteriovorus HD100]|uniref:Uncharacterized protein n=2 Tax=Bdellovibrio bacteriovorus TaxID=959 RepID=Q6MNQ7_BDEBA|nr:hypothetical protein predicted by Glimmer/Critica [Bdellovibrio bacteriovorus HD100]
MNMKKQLWTVLSVMLFAGSAWAQAMGSLAVNGVGGENQGFRKVKAVRCDTTKRGSCDNPVFFDLNKPTAVPAGMYIVGFENSINPDLVEVRQGSTTTLQLERIDIPVNMRDQKVRVYRDMSKLVEQQKIYMTMFYMKRHFFFLDKDNFGDLYLAGAWERDFVQRFTYEACDNVQDGDDAPASVKRAVKICEAWGAARSPKDLRSLFNFNVVEQQKDGSFDQIWVSAPSDSLVMRHPPYLVAVPLKNSTFVSVFPGAYRINVEGKDANGKTIKNVSIEVGNYSKSGSTLGFSLNVDGLFTNLGEGDCASARTWETESRAYCTSDDQEGCDRSAASSCTPM